LPTEREGKSYPVENLFVSEDNHWKTTIGQVPCFSSKRETRKGKEKQNASTAVEVDQKYDNMESREDYTLNQLATPPLPITPQHNEYLKEASALLKPHSYTSSGLDYTDASLFLAALLALSEDKRDAFLNQTHHEMVGGLESMAEKKIRDIKHMNSPKHKRMRRK
jgi:hypothetical protein